MSASDAIVIIGLGVGGYFLGKAVKNLSEAGSNVIDKINNTFDDTLDSLNQVIDTGPPVEKAIDSSGQYANFFDDMRAKFGHPRIIYFDGTGFYNALGSMSLDELLAYQESMLPTKEYIFLFDQWIDSDLQSKLIKFLSLAKKFKID